MTEELTQTKARHLVERLNGRGIGARSFWDRGPWCAQVFLTDDEESEFAPALFIFVEDTDPYKILSPTGSGELRGWRWTASIQDGADGELEDVTLQFLERTWLGDDEDTVAKQVADFIRIFRYSL